MNIEISKEQKASLAEKMALCVEFLKKEVQPHLTSTDKVVLSACNSFSFGKELELHITSKTLSIIEINSRVIGFDFFSFDMPSKHKYTLEKKNSNSKNNKQYICEAYPEAAIEFLKNWDNIKNNLMTEVNLKKQEVDKINNFIDNFEI